MPQVFVVLDEGGRTLLTKAHGDIQIPSFPTVGLLCSISTYSDQQGFSIETFSTHNVCIVYRRFANHLLFVLATSNLLVPSELLQRLLQMVYDSIVLLLGSGGMEIESAGKIDALRKKLRGLTLIDNLIADDTLVPCLMLSLPQSVGIPLRDRAFLRKLLEEVTVASGQNSRFAALLSSQGYYLAATSEWGTLQPQETLLLQHIAANTPEDADLDMLVYLSVKRYTFPLRLFCIRLEQGLQLLLLCSSETELASVQPTVEEYTPKLVSEFVGPIWCTLPVPQFTGIQFDLAIITQHNPASLYVFWGHCAVAPQGFNPLMSPTLRRKFGSTLGSGRGVSSGRIPTVNQEGGQGDSNMQLYYTSCVDLLVSFMLQSTELVGALTGAEHPQQQKQPPQQQRTQQNGPGYAEKTQASGYESANNLSDSVISSPRPASSSVLSPRGFSAISPQRIVASFTTNKSPSGTAASRQQPSTLLPSGDEVHLVTGSNRLVGLTDPSPNGVNVFAVFSSKKVTRLQAAEGAARLKSTFLMSYAEGD
eukprot:gene1985-33405_t